MIRTVRSLNVIDYTKFLQCTKTHVRNVSALYINGDKARENYVTIQPYMDFADTFEKLEALEYSVNKRKMPIDLKQIQLLYYNYKKSVQELDNVEEKRELIAKQMKELGKTNQKDEDLMNQLKEKGKNLRNEMKTIRTNLYPVEDEFIQSYLHIPNMLHPHCPDGEYERILYRSKLSEKQSVKSHVDHDNLIEFLDNSRYYMKNEAAEFDIISTDALTKYFLTKADFIQTANPDFVRCVLLEANATPLEHYHKVVEAQLQNTLNCAYLTGGASFESFLGSVTKLCVYPSVVPLKYVCNGRLYEKTVGDHKPSLYTATQTNAVTTFVATQNQQQAEEQMETILNLCVDFYKSFSQLHFRIVYVKASELTPSESLRAQIEVYSPQEKRYICVGRVSNYSDFVSKRILFTMREKKNYHFLHLVGGPVLYTSRLIAALIESGDTLNCGKVLQSLKLHETIKKSDGKTNAIDEFKDLFK